MANSKTLVRAMGDNKAKRHIEYILFCLFLVFLLDPGDSIFNLKLPLFILLILLWIINDATMTQIEMRYFITFFSITTISLLVGAFYDGSLSFAIGILTSEVLFFLMPVFRIYNGDIIKLFSKACLVMCTLIIIFFVAELVLPHSIIFPIYMFGNEHNAFTIDFRYYAGIRFGNVYFHASPMLVVANAYYTDQYLKKPSFKKSIPAIIVIMSLFLTGSRNNMLISLAIPVILVIIEGNKKQKAIIGIGIIIALPMAVPILKDFFDLSDYSNSIKLGYFKVFGKAINENPLKWITGCGLGTTVYVPTVDREVFLTELTYLNCIYWFGIPMSIILFTVMATPIYYHVDKSKKYLKVIYFSFLYLCMLNPFLFNSVGITVLSMCIYQLYEYKNPIDSSVS